MLPSLFVLPVAETVVPTVKSLTPPVDVFITVVDDDKKMIFEPPVGSDNVML
jgi:hypothetical protein